MYHIFENDIWSVWEGMYFATLDRLTIKGTAADQYREAYLGQLLSFPGFLEEFQKARTLPLTTVQAQTWPIH